MLAAEDMNKYWIIFLLNIKTVGKRLRGTHKLQWSYDCTRHLGIIIDYPRHPGKNEYKYHANAYPWIQHFLHNSLDTNTPVVLRGWRRIRIDGRIDLTPQHPSPDGPTGLLPDLTNMTCLITLQFLGTATAGRLTPNLRSFILALSDKNVQTAL